MPLRPLNRQQTWLLPPTLEELIPVDHPARFIAIVVDNLDENFWQKLGGLDNEALGAPSYHPRSLLSVWLYGFMTGTRSSRKLEISCRDQIPYLWLTGWQHPDHNTLWRFYKEHRDQIRYLFKMTVRTAAKMDLVDLAVQALDGTKVAANANKDRTYDSKGLQRLMDRLDEAIHELEKQNESNTDPLPVHLPEKLRKAEQLRDKVKTAISKLAEEEGRKDINLTDDETVFMKSRQGIIPAYNVEAMASPATLGIENEKGMIITAVETVTDPADAAQLTPMLDQARENTQKRADTTLADAGYHSGDNLADCAQRGQKIVMPESQDKALQNPYHKDYFSYNAETDCYTCPHGQILKFVSAKLVRNKPKRIYHCTGTICRKCPAFGSCTTCRHHGRELQIGPQDGLLKQHREWMKTEPAKTIYSLRKTLIEPIFGILKEHMGFRRFLLRGLANVRAEATMIATSFNLRTLFRYWRILLLQKGEKRAFLNNHLSLRLRFYLYSYRQMNLCFKSL
jgi:transposase